MSLFTKTANDTFAPYNSDGTPRAIVPQDAQVWGTEVEAVINAFTSNGGLIYSSKAALDADLAPGANSMAWVMGDATVGNNGIYRKIGASGAGSWTRVADLPYSFVRLNDVGAGTANAIQLTSPIPTSLSVLRVANVFEANAGNVTISENGAAATSLRTNSGNQVAPGGLVAGGMIVYVDDGTNFRLLSDQASAAIVSAAEAAQVAAEIARDEAEAAAAEATNKVSKAGDTMTGDLELVAYGTSAGVQRSIVLTRGRDGGAAINGDAMGTILIRAKDQATAAIRSRAILAAYATENHDLATGTTGWQGREFYVAKGANGAQVETRRFDEEGMRVRVRNGGALEHIAIVPTMWGAVGNGTTNDTTAFTTLETFVTGRVVDLAGKTYLVNAVPTLNQYVNGSFKVGADVKAQGSDEVLPWPAYHKSYSSRHIKSFGATRSAVGAGSAAADTAALQAAINSGVIVDITGSTLNVNAPIAVTIAGANIVSEKATRVGSNAASKIIVADDAMTKLFDVQQSNFEASGFFIECGSGNVATTLFHFERASGSACDIDAELMDIGHEGGAKVFHHYGRGLKVQNLTSGNVKTCIGDVDFPSSWTPNGQSNDLQETAMRGFEFRGIRMHGAAAGIRNIGANRHNLRGMIMSDVEADIGIGTGIFVGIPGVGSKFSNFVANIGATIAGGLLDLWEGSRDATFANMSCAGIKTGAVTRLNRTAIILRASTANPIEDLTFSNMNIGPTNRSGVSIQGFGAAKNISFMGASWDRTNIEGTTHFPIIVTESGGTFTEVSLKLTACNFKFGAETAPTHIIGGLNSAVVRAYINSGNTKPSAIPWAQSNVVVTA